MKEAAWCDYFQSFEEVHLTHFQYTEWPGGEGEGEEQSVPSSTHGLLGLVEHALAHQELASLTGPIAVHCRLVIFFKVSYLAWIIVFLYRCLSGGMKSSELLRLLS